MGIDVSDLPVPTKNSPHTPEQQALGAQYLRELGWVGHRDGTWTAPRALRQARAQRLGKATDRYKKTDYGHAFNTQRHEDREAPLPGRFSGDELVEAVERRLAQPSHENHKNAKIVHFAG
jgi:hypothetical protein